jgi:hypothetical protein
MGGGRAGDREWIRRRSSSYGGRDGGQAEAHEVVGSVAARTTSRVSLGLDWRLGTGDQ